MQSMSKIFGSPSQRMVVLHQIRRELGLRSSSSTPVQHEMDSITGIATISLNRPPTNILNMEMMQQLISSLKESEQNKCRGLILTSVSWFQDNLFILKVHCMCFLSSDISQTSDKIFTAGLDIKEMYKPDVDRLKEYWRAFQDLWLTWYGSNIPTAALINVG